MKRLLLGFFLAIILILAVGWWATGMFYPDPVQAEQVTSNTNAPILKTDQVIKVMSWNVQFMTGNKNNHFFYDRGTDSFPEEAINHQTIADVARVIIEENPDVVMLQELDQNSRRTHYIDEFAELRALLPKEYQAYSCTLYHKINFLPSMAMPGRITFQLCTLSKYRINKAIRYALPSTLNVDFFTQQFQLKRAILQTDLPIENGQSLTVFNTHLSAFAAGTNTLDIQANIANDLLLNAEKQGPALLAGDFNSLSSAKLINSSPADERSMYKQDPVAIASLIKNFTMFPTIAELSGPNAKQWLTHMPSVDHSHTPAIAIDYMFISKQLTFQNHYVKQQNTGHISDHFPLVADIKLPDK